MAEYQFKLFADYFQFYLKDERADGDLSDAWTPEAVQDLLALADGTIGVGTVRNMSVPVTVQVLNGPPDEDLTTWDRVNECSIHVPSGHLIVAGCIDDPATAARIPVDPGWYRARIYYGDLDTLRDNDLEGDDHYKVSLWPASAITAPARLKP